MESKSVTLNKRPLNKALAHIIKHHKNDCVGVFLGKKAENGEVIIQEAVPLFHDRVFTSTMETAFEMVEAVYPEYQIVGIYDAPLKYKQEDAVPLSSLSITLAE